jgi:nucleoside 2-deoxyribosyltransferase
MKIYFAGSIRAGRQDVDLYIELIKHLQGYGEVLTSHVGNSEISAYGEKGISDHDIYERDMDWLRQADVVVAEVTNPSLGVGYELARAEELGKRVLCIYRPQEGKRLSAMVSGNRRFAIKEYKELEEGKKTIDDYLQAA